MDNNSNAIYKQYKKKFEFSYTLGAFPTMEMIKTKPEKVRHIYIHSKYDGNADFECICKKKNIEVIYNDKAINRISSKENCFVVGVFNKFDSLLDKSDNHIVLVNPSDMGNLGTIIRTMAGFDYRNLAIIAPCADIFNPKTIRASMGAVFRINIHVYDSFKEYTDDIGRRDFFPFMLDGDKTLSIEECPKTECYSLIFGNEASGLDHSYKKIGKSIYIPQSELVDSLNLPVSVAVGSFIFKGRNKM